MKKYDVTQHGVLPDGKTPADKALSALVEKLPDNSTLYFPKGIYYFTGRVEFRDKKGLTLTGEDAVLMTHFEPCGDPANNNNLFVFVRCRDVVLSDFVITTDNPIGWSGVVTAVNTDELYYDVKIYDQFEVTGFEHPVALNTCDSDGTPDYMFDDGVWRGTETVTVNGREITRYGSHSYEVIGDHLCRFKARAAESLSKLRVGEQVCYRFIMYGNCHLSFNESERVLIKNVDMYRVPSMGLVIGGRSKDFTLDHFTVKAAPGSRELFSANVDAIHIYGLGGHLRMKHCEFSGLGDDAMNVHSMPGEIRGITGDNSFEIKQPVHDFDNGGKKFNNIADVWARSGDVIEVYDFDTFEPKGTITVGTLENGVLTAKKITGTCGTGDLLINTAFCPSVHISDTVVKNTRARAFLIRTRDVLIENCYIYGMSLPAILVTPDTVYWYEVGNSRNITIKNNVIEKCGIIKSPANLGAIAVKTCDDDWNKIDYPTQIHNNISIIGNKFINVGNSAVYISSVKNAEVTGNKFENCCSRRFSPTAYGIRHDIVAEECDGVTVKDNISTQCDKKVFWARKCKNVERQ